jgi:hypothetical protein
VLAFASFEFGFAYRVELAEMLPGLKTVIVDFAEADYWLGLVQVSPFLAKLSPMTFGQFTRSTLIASPSSPQR